MQAIRIMNRKLKKHWLHFNDAPRVQEKQQVKDQWYYILISVVNLSYPSSSYELKSRYDNSAPMQGHLVYLQRKRRTSGERINQGCNFLGGGFSNRVNVRAPIHFRRERLYCTSILKNDFSLRTDPPILTSIESELLDWSEDSS